MDNAPASRNLASVLLSFAYTAFAAIFVAELVYSGYGETGPSPAAGWMIFFAGWLTALAASSLVAIRFRAHRGLVIGLTAIAWPPAMFAALVFVFFSSCAGFGPHTCAFS